MRCPSSVSLDEIGWFDEGRGVPVILLHSSATSGRQWARLREPWRARCRTLGVDLWGYGRTPMPLGAEPFRLEHEVALARLLLDRIGGPAHLIGHSYGGAVAARLALDSPEQVLSLSIHEPVLFHLLRQAGRHEEWSEIGEVSQRVLALVEADDPAGAAEIFVDYWNGEGSWRMMAAEQQQRIAASAAKAPLDFEALFHETATLDDYRSLAGRTLITLGEHTRRPAAEVARLLASAVGPDSLALVDGAGHMAPITTPERIRPYIERRLGLA